MFNFNIKVANVKKKQKTKIMIIWWMHSVVQIYLSICSIAFKTECIQFKQNNRLINCNFIDAYINLLGQN